MCVLYIFIFYFILHCMYFYNDCKLVGVTNWWTLIYPKLVGLTSVVLAAGFVVFCSKFLWNHVGRGFFISITRFPSQNSAGWNQFQEKHIYYKHTQLRKMISKTLVKKIIFGWFILCIIPYPFRRHTKQRHLFQLGPDQVFRLFRFACFLFRPLHVCSNELKENNTNINQH